MVRKFLFFAFVSPGLLLLRTSLCRKLVGRWLGRVQVGNDLPLLLSQFEVAAILGAFVPVLLPVALLSFTTNLLARRWVLLSSGSGLELAGATSAVEFTRFLAYLFLGPVLLSFAVCLFFWENSASVVEGLGLPVLSGLPVALAVSVLSIAVSLVYLRVNPPYASHLKEPLLSTEPEEEQNVRGFSSSRGACGEVRGSLQ